MDILVKNQKIYDSFLFYSNELKEQLKDNNYRYCHSVSVAITAMNIGTFHGANLDDCMIAGLMHDYCKCVPIDEMICKCKEYGINLTDEDIKASGCLHGFLASKVCKDKYNFSDEICNAIYYHTCGKPNMTLLEKIIYLSDFVEPTRKFREVVNDIRKMCYINIDKAVLMAAELNLKFLEKTGLFIHSNTNKVIEYYGKIV